MTQKLIIRDDRLILMKAVEYGQQTGMFLDQDIELMKKQGADMSWRFAKKYYRITDETELRQACYQVLGIVNLGLAEASNESIEGG